jgi:endoglucanase
MENHKQLHSLSSINPSPQKNLLRGIVTSLFFVLISAHCPAQPASFHKGVNLTDWFQTSNPGQIQFTKFTKQDFFDIKSLGCDVIRLPINLLFFTDREPDYTIDPLILSFLDSVVNWSEEVQIYLILDNHSYDLSLINSSAYETSLIKMWSQLAHRYENRSEYIIFEIQNEPHDISDVLWGNIQGNVIEAIREIDKIHTIIVGPASWNSFNNLQYMPEYSDQNLIYTFHFYEPFLFTHQGADWTDVSMAPVTGIPFPYDEAEMPDVPAELIGTWVGNAYYTYPDDGTGEKIREWLNIAINFRNSRDIPLFCGEIGVYNLNSPHTDRIAWYDTVQNYLDDHTISWATWDYTGRFGLFEIGGNDLFDYDLDTALLKAIGFNVPPQKDYTTEPDTTGFPVYTDYIAHGMVESSNPGEGMIDFYNTTHPNNDQYCIYWTGGGQYTTVGFNIKPDKDLTELVNKDFAVDFLIRCNAPGSSIDIRYIDSQTDIPEDLPWRMRFTIDESVATWDGKWHHLHIPLLEFTEHGAWDGSWHDPIGAFDWRTVDRLEIVAEHHSLENIQFWFDNIYITDRDTAQIWDTTAIPNIPNILNTFEPDSPKIFAFPNPFNYNTQINYQLNKPSVVQLQVFDATGSLVRVLENKMNNPGKHSINWDGSDSHGVKVKRGVYYCRYNDSENTCVIKLMVL